MIDGVIFDMDGLMFDSERVWGTLWEPAFSRFGLAVPKGLPDAMRGITGDAALATIRAHAGDGVDASAIFEAFYEIAEERFSQGAEKKPGLDELLAYLAQAGLPLAVASSSPQAIVRANLERAGVRPYFAEVVHGREVAHSKPAPDIFLEAARRLGTKPAHTLVLEDSPAGVRAGAAGGFKTVMVPDTLPPTDELRALATCVCRDLNEVRELLEKGVL